MRLTLLAGEGRAVGRVKFVGLSFAGPPQKRVGKAGAIRARVLDVPEKSQLA